MASVMTTTVKINGAAAEAVQVVAPRDLKRKYVALYADTGTVKVSFGEGTHADTYVEIAEGNLLELAVNTLDKISFSTTGTVLKIIQDRDSSVIMTSDNLALTYDGSAISYNKHADLAAPLFA